MTKGPKGSKKITSVYMNTGLKERIRAEADRSNMNVSQIISYACERLLAARKRAREIWREP